MSENKEWKPIGPMDLKKISEALVGLAISKVRFTKPGAIVTCDYDPHRLWIRTDENGVVLEVTLG